MFSVFLVKIGAVLPSLTFIDFSISEGFTVIASEWISEFGHDLICQVPAHHVFENQIYNRILMGPPRESNKSETYFCIVNVTMVHQKNCLNIINVKFVVCTIVIESWISHRIVGDGLLHTLIVILVELLYIDHLELSLGL